jgi:hypothetical protein
MHFHPDRDVDGFQRALTEYYFEWALSDETKVVETSGGVEGEPNSWDETPEILGAREEDIIRFYDGADALREKFHMEPIWDPADIEEMKNL